MVLRRADPVGRTDARAGRIVASADKGIGAGHVDDVRCGCRNPFMQVIEHGCFENAGIDPGPASDGSRAGGLFAPGAVR